MPNRILRDNALDSDRIASVDEASEVFFYRLLMLVDDFGRFDGRLPVIRARAFALRQSVTETEISRRLDKLCAAGLIVRYSTGEKPYIFLPRFGQRQRAEKSKFPDPCMASDSQVSDNCQTPVSAPPPRATRAQVVVVDVDVGVGEGVNTFAGNAARRRQQANGIGFDASKGAFIGITEAQELIWQEAYPAVPIPPAISQAAAWLTANPANRKSNNARFLVNWFKREQDRAARVKR